MTRIKVSEASNIQLDWLVSLVTNPEWTEDDRRFNTFDYYDTGDDEPYRPTDDWSQGGSIIEREKITVHPVYYAETTEGGSDICRQDGWAAYVTPSAYWITPRKLSGPTPLIAAMRCYVVSKLGGEVEVPGELS